MNSDSAYALVQHLEKTASALVVAPDIASLLANFDGLDSSIFQLPDLLQNPNLSGSDKYRLQSSARDCLVHLQRALIYAESRLQHEHQALHAQLGELSTRIQWAQRCRECQ
jgi:hypothetical protein